jgi:hypothetical protein
MRVMAVLVAVDQKLFGARGEGELLPLDAGEGFERRAGRAPAIRAMTVRGIEEGIGDCILDSAAEAFSG